MIDKFQIINRYKYFIYCICGFEYKSFSENKEGLELKFIKRNSISESVLIIQLNKYGEYIRDQIK